jgi:hypothetical protein
MAGMATQVMTQRHHKWRYATTEAWKTGHTWTLGRFGCGR